MDIPAIQKLTNLLRYYILEMTHNAGSGHPTSCFSAVDVMAMLFFKYLHADVDNPNNPTNDRVIFSKGHASALLYSLYAAAGKLTEEELMQYRTFDSPLEGHPTKRFLYAEAATGSLGQGLSIAAGEAFGLKVLSSQKNLAPSSISSQADHNQDAQEKVNPDKIFSLTAPSFGTPHVFVLMGDGELAEGSVWEAVNWSKFHELDNLIVICDINRFGQSEPTMWQRDVDRYRHQFEGFGWATIIIDGHNFSEIDAALQKALINQKTPVAIIAKTIKGKGVPYWEDKDGWHNKMLPKEELAKALELFGKEKAVRGVIQKPLALSSSGLTRGSAFNADPRFREDDKTRKDENKISSPLQYDQSVPIATKKAFGNALERLGKDYPNLIVLDGDVSNSTHTDQFKKTYPDRFLQMYIAEQNMVGVATGLAKRGFLPFITTFACFLTRSHDQLRMAPLSGVTLLVNGAYGGVSMGKDGPSQMGLEDIALFRAIFGSTVLYPSDPFQTERLVEEMLQTQGVVYIRTTREPTPVIYTDKDTFAIGGSKIFHASGLSSSGLTRGSALTQIPDQSLPSTGSRVGDDNDQVTVIAAGITVHQALAAQKELAKENIGIRVIDCYSIKPIDEATIRKAAAETKAIIVVEDHYPEGGLGEAVKSVLADHVTVPIVHLAVTQPPRSGEPQELLDFEGIGKIKIIETVKAIVVRTK